MPVLIRFVASGLAVIALLICFSAKTLAATIDFASQIQPILAKNCLSCHGPDQAESGLSFSDFAAASAETDSGQFAIVAGDVDESALIARVSSDDPYERMPPEGEPLAAEQVELLSQWIAEGAPWSKHWAFEPVPLVEPPRVDRADWNANPIDAFIEDSLLRAGLTPNPPADRQTLIRRAYYDLIGLPPTHEEVAAFVSDDSPDAFAKLVDRLLASPHYGERWGRHWLDLVRYGETNSFERDNPKPNVWKYRDYVIKSFNDDKPYDQFVREQLAGDELDTVTPETLTATGYYRLGIWDDEPADPLQARFDELDDLITTTGQVFLGLTINCARCHDHKIDPIPQTDYYSMLAFFEDVTRYGERGDQVSNHQINVSSEQLNSQHHAAEEKQKQLKAQMQEIEQAGIVKMSAADQRETEGPAEKRREVLKAKLKQHLSPEQWHDYETLKSQLQQINLQRDSLPPINKTIGLARYPEQKKQTFVLFRGNPHSPSDTVEPSFPEIFDEPAPQSVAHHATVRTDAYGNESWGRRRVLADWITRPNNRLTARVMANRIWQFHFGRGIVRSSNNFGQLGTPPTHPELLDWLASQFINERWSVKSMHRLMMNSRAYQMSSASRDDGYRMDPGNDLFWRFDVRRLSAEEVRDSMLAVSGSLNPKVYGPSFYEQLSDEVLQSQSMPGNGWGHSSVDDRNRRSVYIHVKRSLLTPLLSAFDFPDPDQTCEARFMTLQPGQALALLNSDFAHQQAGRLARAIEAESITNDEVARRTIRTVFAREANADEIEDAKRLIESLEASDQISRSRAVELYCLTVLNWNEFLFLD